MRKGEEKEEEEKKRKISLKHTKKDKNKCKILKKVDRSLLKVLSIFAINSNKTKTT